MFGQKVYKSYMEVYKAKVEVITKLPPPVFINGMRSFLGHSDFYLKFIKDFFQDWKTYEQSLGEGGEFFFDAMYLKTFEMLNRNLIEASFLITPNMELPFELMCDASNATLSVVIGQRKNKVFH